ncbi:hypothetical protein L873DRAFT_1389188 [Choiromyces venosus 120613-1]|uniref:MARVEL domain-containing protein n=1 Tax=Choiromyces venosus 120613-1 TaxID=1336337 RepID=A0A3N4J9B0_9PEZI|nr:hypothetical protein L873DRAFT_1389188 [Choiromyces venosus 120613-1]
MMTLDSRWRPLPTIWLWTIQILCILCVLGISAYDISYIRNTFHNRPSNRLIINILCSTTSLVASLVQVYLYLTSRLHPLITLFANTLLAFFWLAACFYQSVALGKLRRIIDKMCPHDFRSRFLWCQNPKMTLLFSVLALCTYSVFIIWACYTQRRALRKLKAWHSVQRRFGKYEDEGLLQDRDGLGAGESVTRLDELGGIRMSIGTGVGGRGE